MGDGHLLGTLFKWLTFANPVQLQKLMVHTDKIRASLGMTRSG